MLSMGARPAATMEGSPAGEGLKYVGFKEQQIIGNSSTSPLESLHTESIRVGVRVLRAAF